MHKALLLACVFAAGAASPVLAANATRPYQNCNRKIDNCGPTGNDMTDRLNAQQLGANGGAAGGTGMPMQGNSTMPMSNDRAMPMNSGQGNMPSSSGASSMRGSSGMTR